ncbi:AAA family ATPase [Hyalangium gracile]|uniref:AAA family ATPase n=1 Tax=Hyalangium gracile TaxID=394092 RepID=UPI001CCA7400|nr:AAA family ATPase [Hyalangium gracile]
MLFSVVPASTEVAPAQRERALLIREKWDDRFEFETTFLLVVFDMNGARHDVGAVKIGQFGMESQRSPALPDDFDSLDERFFSLGQDENYYETLSQLEGGLGRRILEGLRDVADEPSLYERARHEPVMGKSLLRFIREETVLGRFHRLARGDVRLMGFKFAYTFPRPEGADTPPLSLSFEVSPRSRPPTNIHALIGRNGVGKTRCLNSMTRSLVEQRPEAAQVGAFESLEEERRAGLFANLVSVTFSAFDPFGPLPEPHAMGYTYVGLKRAPAGAGDGQKLPPKTVDELTDDFVASVGRCRSGARALRWRRALETLEADPLFKDEDVTALARSDADVGEAGRSEGEGAGWRSRAKRLYERLSAGHKIVLLTLTRLVETVDERTLVLIDEPEAHLHPPLLAAFVRSLSDLLMQRNGVAIIATHSPVVLQEAPRTCVWILQRSGAEVRADRPGIETFGENVGILTREVFGLEVTHAGFHRLLEEAVAETGGAYEAVLERFGRQLGTEARVIARGLSAESDSAPPEDAA